MVSGRKGVRLEEGGGADEVGEPRLQLEDDAPKRVHQDDASDGRAGGWADDGG